MQHLVGNPIIKTDGKREIIVKDGFHGHGIDLHVCTNGFQTTIVNMDNDMLSWLRESIDEYLSQGSE
jgi:hypothetical protein